MERKDRQRILNAITLIATKVKYCGKIKLFKLLYLMDFDHYRETGKSITGYEYHAWKLGPVPTSLMSEWDDMQDDLRSMVHIEEEQIIHHKRQTVRVNDGVEFESGYFTPRQLKIMHKIIDTYKDSNSDDMIEVTHKENGAWEKIWQKGKGAWEVIPYELSVADEAEHKNYILESAREASGYSELLTESDY